MRILVLSFLILFNFIAFSSNLLDEEIVLDKSGCKLNEFCSKYIDDIDIEKFIKEEMKEDYVLISLDECIDIALKNNFNIKINNANYKSSKYDFDNAKTKFLPILYASSYIQDYGGQILVGGVLQDNLP